MARWRDERQESLDFGLPLPWEQLDGESSPAYRAFLAYRDLGPGRTIEEAGRRIYSPRGASGRKKGATGRITEWVKANDWKARAAAWDAHSQRLADAAYIEEQKELRRRQAREIRRDQNILEATAALALQVLKDIQDGKGAGLTAGDKIRHGLAAIKILDRLRASERRVVVGSDEAWEDMTRPTSTRGDGDTGSDEMDVVINTLTDADEDESLRPSSGGETEDFAGEEDRQGHD